MDSRRRISKPSEKQISCHLVTTRSLEDQMERFWKTEEIIGKACRTKEDNYCETQFNNEYTRDKQGRFIVRLPQRTGVILGESKNNALKRLYTIEKRLARQPELKSEYHKFLDEYEELDHMTKLSPGVEREASQVYYMPHQPVFRTTSLTTKLRVVFDGSAKTSLSTSLNDKLIAGPNLQEDIVSIIIRFRAHEYVITADIQMMFR